MNDRYSELVLAILKGQEEIIGPMAWDQASAVPGITISDAREVTLEGDDKKQIIESLVMRYKDFFGQAAIEVCKEAVHTLSQKMSAEELPAMLR